MKPRVVVVSGRSAAGKTSLATQLAKRDDTTLVDVLGLAAEVWARHRRRAASDRHARRALDTETQGRWLVDELNKRLMNSDPLGLVIVDGAAAAAQIDDLRNSGWSVTHVHLDASEGAVRKRGGDGAAGASDARESAALARIADVVIDTDRCSAPDVFARVLARIEDVRPLTGAPLVDVLVGGQYGSEGKGNIEPVAQI